MNFKLLLPLSLALVCFSASAQAQVGVEVSETDITEEAPAAPKAGAELDGEEAPPDAPPKTLEEAAEAPPALTPPPFGEASAPKIAPLEAGGGEGGALKIAPLEAGGGEGGVLKIAPLEATQGADGFGDEAWEEEEIVISATLTPQRVEEAPSIVTSLSGDEIRRMGYYSLEEVLRNVVGFGVNQNGHWPDTGVRGINSRMSYGDKIQIIIDDHDMGWRQFNRNYHNYSWVSMDEVSRIEIIRGPGSALWGAGALSGLVRVILKPHQNLNEGEVILRNDPGLRHSAVFSRFGTTLDEISIYGSVYYYEDDADGISSYIKEFRDLSNETAYVTGDTEDGIRLNLKASYKGLTLSWLRNRWNTQAPLSSYSIFGGDDSHFELNRDIISLKFQQMLTSTLETSAYLSLDTYRFGDGTIYEGNPSSAETSNPAAGGSGRFLRRMSAEDQRYNLRLTLNYVPNLEFQTSVGADVEYLDITRLHFPEVWALQDLEDPIFTNWHAGIFGQVQYSPWKLIGVTGGVRFDYDEVYGSVFNPRAGLVLRLPKGFNIKGLFGTAFKSPSFHDLYYFRRDAFYGNPEVEPEKSMTLEGQLIYKPSRRLDIKLTAFNFKIDDLIVYEKRAAVQGLIAGGDFPASQRPTGEQEYSQKTNLGSVTSRGLELESKFEIHSRVRLQVQGTYREPEDQDGETLEYASKWSVGGAVQIKASDKLSFIVRGLGVGEKKVPERAFNQLGYPSWTTDRDPTLEAPAYFLATGLINYTGFLDRGLDLQLKLDNMSNKAWWDAGRDILYPQKRFQAMLWLRAPLKGR